MRRIPTSAQLSLFIALVVGGIASPPAAGQSAGPLLVNDLGSAPTTASPYPASIRVAAPRPIVANVEVRLTGLAHDSPEDLDVLLASPSGASVLLMSDAGGDTPADVDLTFTRSARSLVPSPLRSGFYMPTDIDPDPLADAFPPPAPPGPKHSTLSGFRGEVADGDWRLFVVDDEADFSGQIDTWTLAVATRAPSPFVSPLLGQPGTERAGVATFTLNRRGSLDPGAIGPASLRYETVVEPPRRGLPAATPGRDYTPVSGTASFAAGASQATVTVPILPDRAREKQEHLWLKIFDPQGDIGLGPGSSQLVLGRTITDDEPRLAKPAVRARRAQRILKQRALVVRVRSNVDASMFATGRIVLPGGAARTIRLKRATAPAPAGLRFPMKLKLSGKGRRLVRRALAAGRRPVARIRVGALAESGAKTAASMRIRLKR